MAQGRPVCCCRYAARRPRSRDSSLMSEKVLERRRGDADAAAIALFEEVLRTLDQRGIAPAKRIDIQAFDLELLVERTADDFKDGFLGGLCRAAIVAQDARYHVFRRWHQLVVRHDLRHHARGQSALRVDWLASPVRC